MKLENIRSPKDLKNLSIDQLNVLAAEIRDAIISQIAKHGGHLASSLGVVELSIALHYVFNTPEDILVWDVGHQAYVHKLLTGRYDQFETLRKQGGLSGFLKRSESPYDAFGAGHASTSISAALGFAVARNHFKKKNKVVAIIGDGSMTGGMAFEALNNAGITKENMTIILNDNKMSISPNVGGFSKYLNRIISDPVYNKARLDVDKLLKRLPGILGTKFRDLLVATENAAKSALKPGRFFEDLGVRYFGPIDGHDLNEVIQILDRVKDFEGPCLIHLLSEKGRGLELAEQNPSKWHASVPFDPQSGLPTKKCSETKSLTTIFGETLLEIVRHDERILCITGAMASGCGLDIVEKEFPERVIDVGIAEEHAVTFAAGLACDGIVPVVAIYSTFLQRAYDQIIHDVALQDLHVVFILDRAGLVGADGPTHHGSFDLTYLRLIPGMVIMAPKDESELRDMVYTAIKYKKGPIAVRYPRGSALGVPLKNHFDLIEIGKAETLRKGDDIALLAVGAMVDYSLKAAEKLEAMGIHCEVVNMRFVKPLDNDLLDDIAARHKKIVTLEENTLVGGFGSGVIEYFNEKNYKNDVLRIGLPDHFVEHGTQAELHHILEIDPDGIVKKVKTFSGKKTINHDIAV